MKGIYAITYSKLRVLTRMKGALFFQIVAPVIMTAFAVLLFKELAIDILTYVISGIILITIFGPFISTGAYFLMRKKLGLMKEILAAPISQNEIILGEIISNTIFSIAPPIVLLLSSIMLGIIHLESWLFFICILLLSFFLSSVSLILAVKLKTIEQFQVILPMLSILVLFMSNAVIPLEMVPANMTIVIKLNPLTYFIDFFRYSLDIHHYFNPMYSLTLMFFFTIISFLLCVLVFKREFK